VTAVRAFGAGERTAHWRAVLGKQLIEVETAEWIEDFPGTLRRLLSFLDLPYDLLAAVLRTDPAGSDRKR
jgi:hypothetical protein